MSSPPQIDLVTVAIAIAALVFSPEISAIVGPYSVIILGAVIGGGLGLSNRPPTSRFSAAQYLVLMVGLALLVSVPFSDLLANHFGVRSNWLLGCVAVVVAWIGPDWPLIGAWLAGVIRKIVERRVQ